MTGHYFLSYSRLDQPFAETLYDRLVSGHSPLPVFMDVHDLKPGQDWDEALEHAVKTCHAVLFLMSADSTAKGTQCKNEWGLALRCRRPVIPLKLEPAVEPPLDFVRRQYVDFQATSRKPAGDNLLEDLHWVHTPEGLLSHQQTLLALAERDWRRGSNDHERQRAQNEITSLEEEITRLNHIIAEGDLAPQRVNESIARAIERERLDARTAIVGRTKFINPPPGIAPAHFQDRIDETKFAAHYLRDETQRMLTIVGRGGVGKTALICRLLKGLESGQFPDQLGKFDCDGIVYLSGAGSHKVNAPNIFQDLIKLLPEGKSAELRSLYEKAEVSMRDKVLALLDAFPSGCTVLLLDNFEDVVATETRHLLDDGLRAFLNTVLTAPHHGLKVILTTRVAPMDFALVQPARQSTRELGSGLPSPYAENILREMDADGSLGLRDGSPELLSTLREQTGGYPKALEALVGWLKSDRETTIHEVLEHAGGCLPSQVVEAFVGEAFSRLDPLAQQVMQALAIYGRPVTANAVDFLLQPWLPVVESARVLNRLTNLFFIRKEADRYFLHPLDSEHALRLLESSPTTPPSFAPPFSLQALRLRGASYFKQIRKPSEQWHCLEDVLPQLAEFDLRFAAGDFETAWHILSSIGFNYLRAWGHYRMLVDLMEKLVEPLSGTHLEDSVLGNLGISYRNVGRTREAIACFEKCLQLVTHPRHGQPDLGSEAVWLSNLGATLDLLGETERSIACHQRAMEIDRQRGDLDGVGIDLHNLAGRFGEQGQTDHALELCRQSVEIARQFRRHDDLQSRFKEGLRLATVASLLLDANRPAEAIRCAEEALEVAATQHSPEISTRAYRFIGLGRLAKGEIPQAVEAFDMATTFDFPRLNNSALAAQGLGRLVAGDAQAARDCFEAVVAGTENLLHHCADHHRALDDQAMARAGLAVCGDPSQAGLCCDLLRRLATLCPTGRGFALRRHKWLSHAAKKDTNGVLTPVIELSTAQR